MRKTFVSLAGIFSLLVFSTVALAQMGVATASPQDTITYKITDEAWVPVWTAKLNVEYLANLDQDQLDVFQDNFMARLNQIVSVGKWNVTSFERQKEASGLEKVNIRASIRVPFKALTGLSNKIESVSKPGAKFVIASIDYTPSLADEEKAREDLRERMYATARSELVRVNKIFPNHRYGIQSITFIQTPTPADHLRQRMSLKTMAMDETNASGPSSIISERISLEAVIVLAANQSGK